MIFNPHLFALCTKFFQIWTGSYFKKTSLGDLGLVIQLGHKLGQTCLIPAVVHSFVVIDVDGIHTVRMSFCECTRNVGSERYWQLLQSCLWPATTIYPQTAATFRVLNLFQVLSFMSKVSTYEFYHTLAHLSDNTELHQPLVWELFISMTMYSINSILGSLWFISSNYAWMVSLAQLRLRTRARTYWKDSARRTGASLSGMSTPTS